VTIGGGGDLLGTNVPENPAKNSQGRTHVQGRPWRGEDKWEVRGKIPDEKVRGTFEAYKKPQEGQTLKETIKKEREKNLSKV